MGSSRTAFVKYDGKVSNSERREKLKYSFTNKISWIVKDWFAEAKNKTHYNEWKKPFLLKTIDLVFNSAVIGVVAYAWMNGNWFVKGFAVTLFFILLKSYVVEFGNLFKTRR